MVATYLDQRKYAHTALNNDDWPIPQMGDFCILSISVVILHCLHNSFSGSVHIFKHLKFACKKGNPIYL